MGSSSWVLRCCRLLALAVVATALACQAASDFHWTSGGWWKVSKGWETVYERTCWTKHCRGKYTTCAAPCMARCRRHHGELIGQESKCRVEWWKKRCQCRTETKTWPRPVAAAEALPTTTQPAATQPAATQPETDPLLSPLQRSALDKHNEYRRKHGVPLLAWSDEVARSAQSHADRCVFAHSLGAGYGENLAWGHQDIEKAIKDWYDEIALYNYNSPGFGMGTGHFTQVVWKGTQEVGCARGNCPGQNLWTCQYSPAGNVMGAFAENVPRPR
ncbi:putative cysteine-rich secretory protein [Chloropicon primus]|uniref:Putative cysteine-rich secretory protein n=1 Tax=Chloropicon primus TaxID=1764295 RepID=A0A5B8MI12_9CHLO|nr:putative cysteine-rich secretory protein [Chloropicon primus]UPQ98220.1 putative cysteine-rich secretory protein [Chloropicon primus]|eukprot:QDZ19012.1 putative cysteine-rich secretory protein [Chloropicon primus]